MAVTVFASGTQVAVVGTEHTLTTLTGGNVYCVEVDASVLLAQDILELRIKGPTLASGTRRVVHYVQIPGVQLTDNTKFISVPFPLDAVAGDTLVTLLQLKGTSRSFPWKVLVW